MRNAGRYYLCTQIYVPRRLTGIIAGTSLRPREQSEDARQGLKGATSSTSKYFAARSILLTCGGHDN